MKFPILSIYIFFILLIYIFFMAQCNSSRTIVVFAGAGLKETFEEIGNVFEDSHRDVKVIFNFAGSPKLIAQLKEGAPGDIIAFPGEKYINISVEHSLINSPGTMKTFAKDKLIIIYPKENRKNIQNIYDLSLPGLKIDIADRSVPAGDYTMKMLDLIEHSPDFEEGFKEKILRNIVSYEDNVRSVVTKAVLGESDAGVVYRSSVTDKVLQSAGTIEIPDEINQNIIFSIGPLKKALEPELSKEFINFILSPEGQKIVTEHGFTGI